MIASTPSDDIADFLRFMTAAMGPDAVRARQPADKDDLAKFLALAKLPLPPLYYSYLEEFGAGDGPLKMADDANPRVKPLIEFYEQQDPADPDVPERGVVIGALGMSGERALLYPPNPPSPAPAHSAEPIVVISWWGSVSHTHAQSFRNHLYRQAFVRGRTPAGVHCSLYRNDPALLPLARQQLEAMGFMAYWFSDAHQACMERDDGSTFYLVATDERTSLYGGLTDVRTLSQVKPKLIAALGLTDSAPNR